jgi:hypothetical protein
MAEPAESVRFESAASAEDERSLVKRRMRELNELRSDRAAAGSGADDEYVTLVLELVVAEPEARSRAGKSRDLKGPMEGSPPSSRLRPNGSSRGGRRSPRNDDTHPPQQ